MSGPLKSTHCSQEVAETVLVDDVYLTGALCLCQYWSVRLQEAQTKLGGTRNTRTERTMQMLIGHYQKLLTGCCICRRQPRT